MANPFNMCTAIGRVTQEPRSFKNSDGSHKVIINLAVPKGYVKQNEDGTVTRPVEFLQFSKYCPKDFNLAPYLERTVGELVKIDYQVHQNDYVGSDGEMVRSTVHDIESITPLETKSAVEARAAAKEAKKAEEAEKAEA